MVPNRQWQNDKINVRYIKNDMYRKLKRHIPLRHPESFSPLPDKPKRCLSKSFSN